VASLEAIREAADRIWPHIARTPLTKDDESPLWLKWENRQATGSFKLRGALNKVLAQSAEARARGLVAASAGNHGQGVAFAARLVGAQVRVFTSIHAVAEKVAAMRALGAEVVSVAGGYGEAEAAAIEDARASGRLWVSPYNDDLIIAGQGTLALEVVDAVGHLEHATVWVPAGGGGLAAGTGCLVRALRPGWRVVAAQSDASAFLHAHFHEQEMSRVVERESLADGLAGPVEAGSQTLGLVREVVDEFVLVDEESIAKAIAEAWWRYGERIEGSAAVALAAARQRGPTGGGEHIVLISGGNISPDVHAELCKRWAAPAAEGRAG
jgi:threonine dehydratase